MKKIELAHFRGIKRFIIVYNGNKTVIDAACPDVPALMVQLAAKNVVVEAAYEVQNVSTTGLTEHAKTLQLNMATLINKFAHKGVAKARLAKNEDLITLMDHEITYFTRVGKEKSISLARDMVKGFVDNPSIFTNITHANITAMTDAIDAFEDVKEDTALAIDARKVDGTEVINKTVKECYDIMQIVYDFVYGEFIDTNKSLVEKFANAMSIEMEGVHHTGITAVCKGPVPWENIDSALLEDVVMTIVELNKTITSNINGVATLIKVKPGTYHVQFSKDKYITQTIVIYFKRGKTVEIEVIMKPT